VVVVRFVVVRFTVKDVAGVGVIVPTFTVVVAEGAPTLTATPLMMMVAMEGPCITRS
jgi:hypothetical protein